MLKGFHERIEQIAKIIDVDEYKVVDRPERKFSSWKGGSIYVNFISYYDKFFTKKKYEMNPQEFYISDSIIP